MITVKQILENYDLVTDKASLEEMKLSFLAQAGLFEETKLPMIRRSLNKNLNEMTMAEKKTLVSLLESLMSHILVEEDHYSKLDIRKSPNYPTDKELPTVIILKRKAIRVFPDHQKVGLYYSQALDRYVSIPFSKDLSPQINEAKKEYQPPEELQTLIQKDPELVGAASNELAKQKYNAFRKKVISNTPIEDLAKNPKITMRDVASSAVRKGVTPYTAGVAVGAVGQLALRRLGSKISSMMNKDPIKESFKEKIKQLKEEKMEEGTAIVPYVARTLVPVASKNISKIPKPNTQTTPFVTRLRRRPNPKSTQKSVNVNLDIPDNTKAPEEKDKLFDFKSLTPDYQFGGVTTKATISGAPESLQTHAKKVNIAYGSNYPIQESNNLNIIKSMIHENVNSQAITIGEETISINKSIAKKIVKLHESLNKTNKKKLERMLNENILSFRKAINFALKQ